MYKISSQTYQHCQKTSLGDEFIFEKLGRYKSANTTVPPRTIRLSKSAKENTYVDRIKISLVYMSPNQLGRK